MNTNRYTKQIKSQQALTTQYFSNYDKQEDSPLAVVAEKKDDDYDLLMYDSVDPEDLGNEF